MKTQAIKETFGRPIKLVRQVIDVLADAHEISVKTRKNCRTNLF